ncbi:hypothetical protein [Nocardia acidivorans]|uniref:hypothetical protein n=1 Tax=Nocardia acidivorans TaxID=404580 RepID=UPI0008361F64|nr:hypothetical protein [Nocardia acidivorans]
MEIFGTPSDRLEDCHVRNDDATMNAAEALEASIIHRDCDPVFCARRWEANRIVGLEADTYAERSNVHPLPTRYLTEVRSITRDP